MKPSEMKFDDLPRVYNVIVHARVVSIQPKASDLEVAYELYESSGAHPGAAHRFPVDVERDAQGNPVLYDAPDGTKVPRELPGQIMKESKIHRRSKLTIPQSDFAHCSTRDELWMHITALLQDAVYAQCGKP